MTKLAFGACDKYEVCCDSTSKYYSLFLFKHHYLPSVKEFELTSHLQDKLNVENRATKVIKSMMTNVSAVVSGLRQNLTLRSQTNWGMGELSGG